MNLIRVMPAEEFVALPCGVCIPPRDDSGNVEIPFMIQPLEPNLIKKATAKRKSGKSKNPPRGDQALPEFAEGPR